MPIIDTFFCYRYNPIRKRSEMARFDFSSCSKSGITYSGSERKCGIVFCNANWMIKYRKKNYNGELTNDISEYLGSKIFSLLGFEAQQVLLGTYENEFVVACKDFMSGINFTPFDDVGESSLEIDKSDSSYTYDNIQSLILQNNKIVDKKEAIELFWNVYIVDCLIANDDRHGKNWGYLKKNNQYFPAPIFDNGNSLFSNFNDENELSYAISNDDELKDRVYRRPRSVVKNTRGSNDYYSVISSKEYEECNAALIRMTPTIEQNMQKIMDLIDSVDLSKNKKEFLKKIIKLRFELIISKTYDEVLQNEKKK